MESENRGGKIFFRIRYECKYPISGLKNEFRHVNHWADYDLQSEANEFAKELKDKKVHLNGGELVGEPSVRKVFGEYEEGVDMIYEEMK